MGQSRTAFFTTTTNYLENYNEALKINTSEGNTGKTRGKLLSRNCVPSASRETATQPLGGAQRWRSHRVCVELRGKTLITAKTQAAEWAA